MPVHLGQQTSTFPQPNPRFASPVPESDQYQCKSFIPRPNARFANPVPPAALDELCKPSVPVQTKNNNNWAKGIFKSWITSRNASIEEKYPANLLEVRYPFHVIDRTLAAFVIEPRRVDGNHFPGTTLKNIMAALFRVMKENQGAARERYYPQLNATLDRQLRMLRNSGIGTERKRAEVITADVEAQMWAE